MLIITTAFYNIDKLYFVNLLCKFVYKFVYRKMLQIYTIQAHKIPLMLRI